MITPKSVNPQKNCKRESLKISLASVVRLKLSLDAIRLHPSVLIPLPRVCLPLSPTQEPEVRSLIQARPQSTRQRFSRGRPATLRALLSTRVLRGASFSPSFVSVSPLVFLPSISVRPSPSSYHTMFSPSLSLFTSLFFSKLRSDRAIVL